MTRNKNYTGILNYIIVYEPVQDETPFYHPVIGVAIGKGIRVIYQKSVGNVQHSHALVDKDGNALTPGHYAMAEASDDVLVVVNTSIH
jgi:hypothetical protein